MEIMGLKALITGGTGFIGSNLIKALIEKGWEVYVVIRKNSTIGYKKLERIKNIKYIYVEELFSYYCKEDNESLLQTQVIPQFDVCFHLASYGVDYRQQDISEMINGNIKFTMDVLNFCKENRTKKVINTGSCFQYGINKGRKLTEEDKLNSQTYYSVTKVTAENMANIYAENNNINLITIRPFGVFGENEGLHRFIPQLMKSMVLNEKMDMTYGEQIRDYLYIKDLIEAYITLALKDVPKYEAYNICSGEEITIKEMALKALSISNNGSELFNFGTVPYRKNEAMYFVGDNSKIKKYTGWMPKYTLEEGLKRTYEWYKVNMGELI